jgi:dCTP deaminase
MLIVGESLRNLIRQRNIVERHCLTSCFDDNSIALSLDRQIVRMKATNGATLHYGDEIPDKYLEPSTLHDEPLLLGSREAVLGCSCELITFPMGYFGLLQTKGSLARMFVSICCCDGQIEGGFEGKITFEIVNHSEFQIEIRPLQPVAQLFVFKTSSRNATPYDGRYQKADRPTVQLPRDKRFEARRK